MRAGRKIVPVLDGVTETEGPFVTRVSDITVHQVCEKDGSIAYRKDRVAQRDCTMGSLYDWDAIERQNAHDRGEEPAPADNPELTDDSDEIVFVPIVPKEKKPVLYCQFCGGEIVYSRSKRFCGVDCQHRAYARKCQERKRADRLAKEAVNANQ